MFNIGTGEIALIAVVALLLLGPQRLPELARGIGKFMREFRRQTDDVRNVVEREFYRMDEDVRREDAPRIAPPADIVSNSKFVPPNKQSAKPVAPLTPSGVEGAAGASTEDRSGRAESRPGAPAPVDSAAASEDRSGRAESRPGAPEPLDSARGERTAASSDAPLPEPEPMKSQLTAGMPEEKK